MPSRLRAPHRYVRTPGLEEGPGPEQHRLASLPPRAGCIHREAHLASDSAAGPGASQRRVHGEYTIPDMRRQRRRSRPPWGSSAVRGPRAETSETNGQHDQHWRSCAAVSAPPTRPIRCRERSRRGWRSSRLRRPAPRAATPAARPATPQRGPRWSGCSHRTDGPRVPQGAAYPACGQGFPRRKRVIGTNETSRRAIRAGWPGRARTHNQ